MRMGEGRWGWGFQTGVVPPAPHPHSPSEKEKIATGSSQRRVFGSDSRIRRAHRHWNSTSYRTAAGYIPKIYGAEGSRTPDLCSAIAALSQLSYSPSK